MNVCLRGCVRPAGADKATILGELVGCYAPESGANCRKGNPRPEVRPLSGFALSRRSISSRLWVLRTLRRNSVLAARRGDTAASNRAAELIGKHLNMFVDRK